MSTKRIDLGWQAIKKAYKQADNQTITVGIHEPTQPHGTTTVGDVAYFVEYGTQHMPARPFLTPPVQVARSVARDIAEQMVKGKVNLVRAAQVLQDAVRAQAPVDTGKLQAAITAKVGGDS